jgi:hypothetical protein
MAADIRSELCLYPGQVHAFFNHEPYTTATLLPIEAFLTSLHLIDGPTPPISNPLAPDRMPAVTR